MRHSYTNPRCVRCRVCGLRLWREGKRGSNATKGRCAHANTQRSKPGSTPIERAFRSLLNPEAIRRRTHQEARRLSQRPASTANSLQGSHKPISSQRANASGVDARSAGCSLAGCSSDGWPVMATTRSQVRPRGLSVRGEAFTSAGIGISTEWLFTCGSNKRRRTQAKRRSAERRPSAVKGMCRCHAPTALQHSPCRR